MSCREENPLPFITDGRFSNDNVKQREAVNEIGDDDQ